MVYSHVLASYEPTTRHWGLKSLEAHGRNQTPLNWGEMSQANSSAMDAEAEVKKRQNEDTTPPSMSRQPKTKRNDEGNEAEKKDQTQRELFPAQPSSYKTYYTKEHQKGKEPRWKQQQATVEERTLQAQTPQTAKKPATASKEATDLNRQLAEQIAVAQ